MSLRGDQDFLFLRMKKTILLIAASFIVLSAQAQLIVSPHWKDVLTSTSAAQSRQKLQALKSGPGGDLDGSVLTNVNSKTVAGFVPLTPVETTNAIIDIAIPFAPVPALTNNATNGHLVVLTGVTNAYGLPESVDVNPMTMTVGNSTNLSGKGTNDLILRDAGDPGSSRSYAQTNISSIPPIPPYAGSVSTFEYLAHLIEAQKGVYDVKFWFGAKGDGKVANVSRIATGSTALFCSATIFTAADVGKVFSLYRTNNANWTTTVAAFVNTTNVTLAAAPDAGTTNLVGVYGSDDTTNIQAATDFVSTNGGGTLFFPSGIYIVNGALRDTSGNGRTNHNAQVFAPNIAHSGNQCPVICFMGPTIPGGRTASDFFADAYGTTIWSTLASGPDGTNYGNVFDFRSTVGSGPGILDPAFTVPFNFLGVATKNIRFRAAFDNGMALFNAGGAIIAKFEDTTFDDGYDWAVSSYYPGLYATRSNTIGVIFPQIFNDNKSFANNVGAYGFYHAVCLGENLKAQYIGAYHSVIGFDFYNAGSGAISLEFFHSDGCKTNFFHNGGFAANINMYGLIQQQSITNNWDPWYDKFGSINGWGKFIVGNSGGTISPFTPDTFADSPHFEAECTYNIGNTVTGPRMESKKTFNAPVQFNDAVLLRGTNQPIGEMSFMPRTWRNATTVNGTGDADWIIDPFGYFTPSVYVKNANTFVYCSPLPTDPWRYATNTQASLTLITTNAGTYTFTAYIQLLTATGQKFDTDAVGFSLTAASGNIVTNFLCSTKQYAGSITNHVGGPPTNIISAIPVIYCAQGGQWILGGTIKTW
jgi:hypothetical protein